MGQQTFADLQGFCGGCRGRDQSNVFLATAAVVDPVDHHCHTDHAVARPDSHVQRLSLPNVIIIYFLYKTKQRNHVRHSCEFVKLSSSLYDHQLYALDVQPNASDSLAGSAKANLLSSQMCPMGMTL